MSEQERREEAYAHRGEVVEGSGEAITPRELPDARLPDNVAAWVYQVRYGCFWHRDEPIPQNPYQVCGECRHAWPDRDAWVADVRKMNAEVGTTADPDTLVYCPLCAHDL